MSRKRVLTEKTEFIKDPEDLQTNENKNSRLADLLRSEWLGYAIVRVDRIEIGRAKGWRVTHRE